MLSEIHVTDSTLTCADPMPELPILTVLHKLRGAMGRVLAQSASDEALRGSPCPFQPACSYALFHNSQGMIHSGLELPKPFVLRAQRKSGTLTLVLRLFGEASGWRHGFHEAWIAAARRGIDERDQTTPFDITSVNLSQNTIMPQPKGPSSRLRLITPLILRSPRLEKLRPGQVPPTDVVLSLLSHSLGDRLLGIANWHGHEPAPLSPTIQLHSNDSDLRIVKIRRGPRQKRTGVTGQISLSGLNLETQQALAVAQHTHLGADTAIGAGRFTLL